MNQQINLQTKSLTELKALAYDIAAVIQQYQQMLQATNQEITLRAQQEQESKAVEQQKQKEEYASKLKVAPKEEAEVVETN